MNDTTGEVGCDVGDYIISQVGRKVKHFSAPPNLHRRRSFLSKSQPTEHRFARTGTPPQIPQPKCLQRQKLTLEAWHKNSLVRRIVTLTCYVLGGGITRP